jgi:23S rRNA pseudouridine1911/1915/1917 synthase
MAVFTAQRSERIDTFLAKELKISRATVQILIKEGCVFIDAKKVLKASQRVHEGEKVAFVEKKKEKKVALQKNARLPVSCVFENKNVLVISKPAGVLAHPTHYNKKTTVANWLLAHYPDVKDVGEHSDRPGIVHRLDKDTSGLMVIARTQESFFNLKHQFASRTMHKKYFALVLGVPKERSGEIDYPLSVSLKGTVKRKADTRTNKGTPALTKWRVKETFGKDFALLEVEPKTGRTHQIRVHLAAIHHPVVGDPLYGGKLTKQLGLKRQFLHAFYLKLKDVDDQVIAVEISLSRDLEDVLAHIPH